MQSLSFYLLIITTGIIFIIIFRSLFTSKQELMINQYLLVFSTSVFIPIITIIFKQPPFSMIIIIFFIGIIPAILTSISSFLLRKHLFKRSQLLWLLFTVAFGFAYANLPVILLFPTRGTPSVIEMALFLGMIGAFCSLCSALALLVLPKE